ncbi:MAG TPA: DUF4193 family protein [Actinomycetota bacterium]|nr:DUF4193 family protein [Actinomycetota bacterium]
MSEEIDIDIDETLDEDDSLEDDDAEPTAADLDDVAATTDPPVSGDVESIQEILQKQEDTDDDAPEEDDAVLATITKDEKLEPIDTRVVPIQATEFTCTRCFLVKHRSQLADKKRTLCRDCA